MSVIKKIEDVMAGGTGGYISLNEVGSIVSENVDPDTEQALINSVIAVVIGLVTTGIKDLFRKIFKKKKKKSKESKDEINKKL